ncbi:hypothetical protein ACVIGB_000752 [Bradyrhizobium sp. USDA 4341]
MPDYPVHCFIRMKSWDTGALVPVKAPLEVLDPMEAYSPFVYASLEEARMAVAKSMLEQWQMVVDGDLEFLDVDNSEEILSCDVHDDGAISFEDFELGRATIFANWDVTDPARAAAPAA